MQIAAAQLTPTEQACVPTPAWTPQHRASCNRGPDCRCPQVRAYASDANVIGYGGEAGGGKTDLLLGYAGTKHHRAIIFRRVFPKLEGIEARSREIYNPTGGVRAKDHYNESLHRWELATGATVRFAAMQYEGNKQDFQGRPYDFYGFDEVTEFTESQVRFVTAWNRTTKLGQECRVVMVFNPPLDEDGEWVIKYFGPWLDPDHAHPAKDGELRWFAMVDGKEIECGPEPFEHNAQIVRPRSRTFFHAGLKDNPILEATGYQDVIDALPEPLRSLLKGNFNAAKAPNPWQAIPTAWIRAAQGRWEQQPKPKLQLSALGVDVAYGGRDQTVIAERYGHWLAPLRKTPGRLTPDGKATAVLVINAWKDNASINVDNIGWGSAAFEHLTEATQRTVGVNFGEGSEGTDRSGKLRFANRRAEAYWMLRERLDPESGYDICLPDDSELLSDLAAIRWELRSGKIYMEPKENVKERIGRSPDCGDAVVLAFWNEGSGDWSDVDGLGKVEEYESRWK